MGIASAHTVRVLDGMGREVCRRRCEPTVASLAVIEQAALAGAVAGTRLEVVIEPTGPAWLPVAVFFIARGHLVFRVSSAKAADLRRFLSGHAKSNGIDADTLARLPLVAAHQIQPLELPGSEQAALDRRVRVCDRLTMAAAEHKVRIKSERTWTVMNRRMPYVVCDTDGTPVSPTEAKKIIAECWTVPTDVRTRRRSRKTKAGKAPQQVPTGHDRSHAQGMDKRGDLPRPRSSNRYRTPVKPTTLTTDPQ
ncbi:MAG TPA: transposase [Candidatus Limnocylindrales bacterium]